MADSAIISVRLRKAPCTPVSGFYSSINPFNSSSASAPKYSTARGYLDIKLSKYLPIGFVYPNEPLSWEK
jgi:hypothetical protein